MTYTKKDPNDPDPEDLNPEIVGFARANQFLRGPLELFLNGTITYRECLETIILLVMKEHKAQGAILVSVLQEKPHFALSLSDVSSKFIKALPQTPCARSSSSTPITNESDRA